MGLFDTGVPHPNMPSETPGTGDLLRGIGERAVMPTQGDVQDELRRGTDTSALLNAGMDKQEGFSNAVKSRYERPFAMQQQASALQAPFEAQKEKFNRMAQSYGLLQKERQMNQEISMIQDEYRRAKNRARAQVLGSLLGVAAISGGAALAATGNVPAGLAVMGAGSQLERN